ncbi:MAG: Dabb family protein [Acidobacteria bacterium]|nr:Dabb family protein [Acidobacteriota bacterium]
MIAHIVLFRPRADLAAEGRRARVGRRVRVGRPYEALMRTDYPYAAVLEFDDRAGLMAYLDHPVHERLASEFFSAFEDALLYDFELQDGTAGLTAPLPPATR